MFQPSPHCCAPTQAKELSGPPGPQAESTGVQGGRREQRAPVHRLTGWEWTSRGGLNLIIKWVGRIIRISPQDRKFTQKLIPLRLYSKRRRNPDWGLPSHHSSANKADTRWSRQQGSLGGTGFQSFVFFLRAERSLEEFLVQFSQTYKQGAKWLVPGPTASLWQRTHHPCLPDSPATFHLTFRTQLVLHFTEKGPSPPTRGTKKKGKLNQHFHFCFRTDSFGILSWHCTCKTVNRVHFYTYCNCPGSKKGTVPPFPINKPSSTELTSKFTPIPRLPSCVVLEYAEAGKSNAQNHNLVYNPCALNFRGIILHMFVMNTK